MLETDVGAESMDAPTVDARYRDLQKVERDFRLMKTTLLELRPIFVRKASRTRGHVFCAMLALKLAREFERALNTAEATLTISDALQTLSRLCFQRYQTDDQPLLLLPQTDQKQEAIFKAVGIRPPRRSSTTVAPM